MARARFDLINAVHRTQVEGISGQPIERVGRHPQHLPGANLVGDVADQRSFRSFTVDLEDFYAHRPLPGSLYLRKVKITRGWALLMCSLGAGGSASGSRMISCGRSGVETS